MANFIYKNDNFIENIHLITYKELKDIFKNYKKIIIPNNNIEEILDELSDSLYQIEDSEDSINYKEKNILLKSNDIDDNESNNNINSKNSNFVKRKI